MGKYGAIVWAPKGYNPDDKKLTGGKEQSGEVHNMMVTMISKYIPCTDQNDKTTRDGIEISKAADSSNNRKVVISASTATVTSREKPTSLLDAVQDVTDEELAVKKKEN
ncbi:hypothetical protein AgCh_026480 [Apium graveolens]